MSNALNSAHFKEPRWLNGARGADPLATGWPEYNGGIEMPAQEHLKIGIKYFRFASSKANKELSQLGGPWWVEYETLKIIADYSRQFSTPRDSVRYMLSIPWQWSEIDKLVCAILEKPLDAYIGRGKPAQSKAVGQEGAHPNDKGTRYIPPTHLEIKQLYIPGLVDPVTKSTNIRTAAFPRPEIKDIWSSGYF